MILNVTDRVNIIRLIDKINENKESCERMGINVVSKYKEDEKKSVEKESAHESTRK